MKISDIIDRFWIIMTSSNLIIPFGFTSHQLRFLKPLFRLPTQGYRIIMLERMQLVIAWLHNMQNDDGLYYKRQNGHDSSFEKSRNVFRSWKKIYYQEYLNDPKHRIRFSKARSKISSSSASALTQKKIDYLIHCIVTDELNLTQASNKAHLSGDTAKRYYSCIYKIQIKMLLILTHSFSVTVNIVKYIKVTTTTSS